MGIYTRTTDTGTIEHRTYDPRIVTNIFAENEIIEWAVSVWGDEYGNTHVTFESGVIVNITRYHVIFKKYRSDEHFKRNKNLLANRVDNHELAEIIEKSMDIKDGMGSQSTNLPNIQKPAKKRKLQSTLFVIYTLSDPRDQSIRYVGISKNMDRRLKEHLACVGLNFKKNIWVQDLLINGMAPMLTIIESNVLGLELAKNRERYWIHQYLNAGAQLTNIAEVDEE